MEFRNEFKYICTKAEFLQLKNRLGTFMKVDKNVKDELGYNIRSVYFDDYENSYFYENDAGFNERMKIRIRIYDKKANIIKLEIKSKKDGFTKKESCNISKEVCESFLNGVPLAIDECENDVLKKTCVLMNTCFLQPKVIVEYERFAYIDNIGNVRITFDQNIRASREIERFFDDDIYPMNIQDADFNVLEVKYDELIPDYVKSCINMGVLNKTAFSKYYLSILKLGE